MANSQAERNTVGNGWNIRNDPGFDDHLGRAARRKAQRAEARLRALNRFLFGKEGVFVCKLYEEWCVVTTAGELAITSGNWRTAFRWAEKMYARPF